MSSIENKRRKKSFYLITIFGVFFVCWILLSVGDYFVARFMMPHENQSEADNIVRNRYRVDLQERELAISEGYLPHFFPQMVDWDDRIHAIAKRYQVAPLAPQILKSLYFCNEGYGLVRYKSDRYGFRNNDASWDAQVDVLLIGDSFVHGACVNNQHTIGGNLEKKFNVLNLGTDANSPIHYAAISKVFLPKTKPKVAIMFFYTNDNQAVQGDNYYHQFYFKSSSGEHEYEDTSNLKKFYEEIQKVLNNSIHTRHGFIKNEVFFEKIINRLKLVGIQELIKYYLYTYLKLDPYSSLAIHKLKESCAELHCVPIIVFLPNSKYWNPDHRADSYEALLAAESYKSNVHFLSLTKLLRSRNEDEIYAPQGSHFSIKGYALVANEIQLLVEQLTVNAAVSQLSPK